MGNDTKLSKRSDDLVVGSDRTATKLVLGITAIVVLCTWICTPAITGFILREYRDSWLLTNVSKASQFGDIFGSISSLFSGLALSGIVAAIFLQQRELELTRQEMKKSVTALNDQIDLNDRISRRDLTLKLYDEWVGMAVGESFLTSMKKAIGDLESFVRDYPNQEDSLRTLSQLIDPNMGQGREDVKLSMFFLYKLATLKGRGDLDDELVDLLLNGAFLDMKQIVLSHILAPNYEPDESLRNVLLRIEKLYDSSPFYVKP